MNEIISFLELNAYWITVFCWTFL